jgi:hypothetical protein
VPGAAPPAEFEPSELNLSPDGSRPCCPVFTEFDGTNGGETVRPVAGAPPSLGGSGLFRGSFRDVVEAEGVTIGDWAASLDEVEADGDEVPSFDSLFFLDDLFGSFVRES